MIRKLFPYKLQLNILQLENYETKKFIGWVFRNFSVRKLEGKKPLVWTLKAKLIFALSLIYASALAIILFKAFSFWGLVFGIILATQPLLFLILARASLAPLEALQKRRIKKSVFRKIGHLKSHNQLKIIGITGSYGKTSTKEFLYQMLKVKYPTLRTPNSFNTLLGIAKVASLELDENYKFFICEMGAYKKGEIKEICSIFQPDYAILTGINEQHLERFGSIKNTVRAKFELIQAIQTGRDNILLNADSPLIVENYKKYTKNPNLYGFSNSIFGAENIKYNDFGTKFTLILKGRKMKAATKLLGKSNISNIVAASSMACILGVSVSEIITAIASLKPVPHRLEIKNLPNGTTIIDDSYNSNIAGFKAALDLLNNFHKRPKVLVTPGIVELGQRTKRVHRELGKIANKVCDYIILVGDNARTKAIKESAKGGKTLNINSITELKNKLETLKLKNPVILIENDLPDNY